MDVVNHTDTDVICNKDGKLFKIPRSLAQISYILAEAAVWVKCSKAYTVCVFHGAPLAEAQHNVFAFVCFTPSEKSTEMNTLPGRMTCAPMPQLFLQFGQTIRISKMKPNIVCDLPTEIHTEGMKSEAIISADLQKRVDIISAESRMAAENVNAYETLEGYTKLRVKRAFLCLNEHTISTRIKDIESAVSRLRCLIAEKHESFGATFEIPEDAHVGDMYSPHTCDYALLL